MTVQPVRNEYPSALRQAIEAGNSGQALRIIKSSQEWSYQEGDTTNLILALRHCPYSLDTLELIKLLIADRSVEALHFRDRFDNTAMSMAAYRADVAAIDLLFKRGASVNDTRGEMIKSPLYVAAILSPCGRSLLGYKENDAQQKTIEAVRSLLRHGATMNFMGKEKNFLEYYIKSWNRLPSRDPNLVTCLVEEGAPLLNEKQIGDLMFEEYKEFLALRPVISSPMSDQDFKRVHAANIATIHDAIQKGVKRKDS